MPVDELIALAEEALLLSVAVALPVLAVAWVVSLVASVLGAATEIGDSTLVHLPRLVLVAMVLAALGPWIGGEVVSFASRAFLFGS